MNKNTEVKNICHLQGFVLLSKDEIKIDNRFCLRKLRLEEIEQLRQTYKHSIKNFYDWESYKYCIENDEDKDLGELRMEFYEIEFALWLFSGFSIYIGSMISLPFKKFRSHSIVPNFRCNNGWGIWRANKDEIIKFSVFWNYLIQNKIQFSGLWRRFLYWGLKGTRDECIIHTTTAMENILLPDINRELSFRFSLRAGVLLGNNYNKRKKIVKIFKNAYNERSKIVHGNKRKDKYSDQELLLYLHFCRKIICLYSENQSIWKKSLSEIELGENRLNYGLVNSMLNIDEIMRKLKKKG